MMRFLKFWLVLALAMAGIIGLLCYRRSSSLPPTEMASPPAIQPAAVPLTAVVNRTPDESRLSDAALLRLARQIVARSPPEALTWALHSMTAPWRQRRLLAVLQAWGEVDPHSAWQWLWARNDLARDAEMKALLAGAVQYPDVAIQAGWQIIRENSDAGGVYAALLSQTLATNGKYSDALQWIDGLPADVAPDAINALFRSWIVTQPQTAMQAIESLTNSQMQTAAFPMAAAIWSQRDPAGLAAYALTMPTGDAREQMLSTAMNNWSLQDPGALATWLNTLPPGPEFDQGVAAMLARTDSVNCAPEVAIEWIENMSDPGLKENSLLRVLGQWSQTAPLAAQQYIATSTWLSDDQRVNLLNHLAVNH